MSCTDRRFPTALLMALLCAGCSSRPAARQAVAALPPGPAPDGVSSRWSVVLDMTPGAPKSYDPTALTVWAADAEGRPIRRATVTLHLDMPAMPMGDTVVTTRETSAGAYAGTARFTMAGKWRVEATVAGAAGRTVRVFPVEVR